MSPTLLLRLCLHPRVHLGDMCRLLPRPPPIPDSLSGQILESLQIIIEQAQTLVLLHLDRALFARGELLRSIGEVLRVPVDAFACVVVVEADDIFEYAAVA